MDSRAISDAVSSLGWRYLLGAMRSEVPVHSMAEGVEVAAIVVAAGQDLADHLSVDMRPDRVILTVQSPDTASVTGADIDLVHRVSGAVQDSGWQTQAGVDGGRMRSVQSLEIGLDAMDIASIRPFWKAVTGYADEAGSTGAEDPLVDPLGQGPSIWFQQMDAPRPQRNRIHFDVSVPHDEAVLRIEAALAAGGVLLSDTRAPAFWVLADAEGNEACVTTWQGRDS